jgi:FkbM family methyltransferase
MDFWYREDDRYIGQRIALGKYEKYETALLLSQIGRNDVAVDVGANIGYYTTLLAQKAKKVYAIEPDEENFLILKKNVEENNLKNVVLLNCAAGNKKETKYLIKDKENFGNSRLNGKKGEVINCLRLDDILVNEQYISSIKIDTQGWEPAVVEGAKKIIERDSPTLFLEYAPGEYKDKNMIKFLKSKYKNIWSINDYAEVSWPISKGVVINSKSGFTDLWMKQKMTGGDYWAMVKNVDYRKVIKGIMGLCQK